MMDAQRLWPCPRCGSDASDKEMRRSDGSPLRQGDLGTCNLCGAILMFDVHTESQLRGLTDAEWATLKRQQPELYNHVVRRQMEILESLPPRVKRRALLLPTFTVKRTHE